jgi:hypothetical protein
MRSASVAPSVNPAICCVSVEIAISSDLYPFSQMP